MAQVTAISTANQAKRKAFRFEHLHDTIDSYWHQVFFTDEAHVDPAELYDGYVLREEGTRYDDDNLLAIPKSKGVELHMAAWVN